MIEKIIIYIKIYIQFKYTYNLNNILIYEYYINKICN